MRQLLAIQRHGSLAKAAQALHISQPALSKSIARLEDELKVRLFDRSSAGSEITPIGEMIAERAARLIVENDGLRRDAALAAGGEEGYVRLGVGTSLTYEFLPRLALKVAETHPNLDIHFEVNERERLVPALLGRELDILFSAPVSDLSDLVTVEMFRSRRVIVAAPHHPLTGRTGLRSTDLVAFRCAGGVSLDLNTAELSGFSAEVGFETRRPYTSNDFEALMPLAIAGKAVLFTMEFLAQPFIDAGVLVKLDVDWDFDVSFAATTTRAASYSPILAKIIRYGCEIGAELERAWRSDGEAARDSTASIQSRNIAAIVTG